MCGIAIILNYASGPSCEPGAILRIREAMAARGPDGAGVWTSPDRRVQLAHRRLAIVDLSDAGSQPMESSDRSLVVVFNGEIYNHLDLRAELEREGVRFRTRSDTEVLLHLYALSGADMVNRLRGMYAFALWDSRRCGLLLARDPLGIKPLYYSDDGRTLRVASQVKALLAGGGVDTSPEPAGHAGFFLWGHVPTPYTLYRGIRSLPAGATLWIDQRGNRRQKVFCTAHTLFAQADVSGQTNSPWSGSNQSPPNRNNPVAQRELLREVITDTVRHHLLADIPVGLFLSAGLDSAILASVGAQQGCVLETITLGFEEFRGTAQDETILAERTARAVGARHHTVWMGQRDFSGCLERFFSSMDQPSIDGLNSFLVSLAASRLGCKAALSGVGADELFGGYPGFRQIPRAVSVLGPLAGCPGIGRAFRRVSAQWFRTIGKPKYASLLEYGGTWSGAYLVRRGLFMPWEMPDDLESDLARAGLRKLQEQGVDEPFSELCSSRLKVSFLEASLYLRDRLLRDADWAGLANGVEIRTPYADAHLVRKVAGLCASGVGPSKSDAAQVCAPRLPKEILCRRKTGFAVPLGRWFSTTRHRRSKVLERVNPGMEARKWAGFVYRQFVKP